MLELGRYRLIRPIGRGGMAEIWKAKTTGPQGFVKVLALKMILPEIADDRLFMSMFVDEAKLAASLVHPNLVSVFDFGEVDGRLILAMEYIAGANLDRVMSRLHKAGGALEPEVAVYVALQACLGLGHAHARTLPDGTPLGIVHRDVSPQNLLVSASGDVKVSDFGIAKAATALMRTAAGQVRGKLAYMSPEQLARSTDEAHTLDGRSDLFSLGIVLYEMLVGTRLFTGGSSEEVSERVRRFNPAADLDLARVSAPMRELLVVMLQPDRERRYRDAVELEAELNRRVDLSTLARARQVLGAHVTRLFREELATDAADEQADEPGPEDSLSGPTLAHTIGGAPLATKVEGPTGSRARRVGPDSARPPVAAAEIAPAPAPASAPRRRRWPLIALGALGLGALAAGAAWRLHASAPAPGAPHRGGVLRIAMAFEAEDFDVYSVEMSRTRRTLTQVIEPLLRVDRDGAIVPWTLDHTELANAGRSLVLSLREGVLFHDHPCLPGGHGRAATGEDVAYSLREALRRDQLALPIRGAGGITVTGAREVTLELTSPAPFYAGELANVMLLPHELDHCEDLRRMKQPVGTGPFRFERAPEGTQLQLVRAPSYWHHDDHGEELPYLDGLEVLPVDDLRDVLSRMARGEIDVTMTNDDQWPDLIERRADHIGMAARHAALGLDLAAYTSHSRVALMELINGATSGPLADARVRRALALAIDRPALIAASTRPLGGPAGRFLDPRMLGYDSSVASLGYAPDAARALLAEAGYPDGTGIPPLTIGTMRNQTIAALIARQAGELGLHLSVRTIAPTHAVAALEHGEVDLMLATDSWALVEGEDAAIVAESDRFGRSPTLAQLHLELDATPDRADRAPIYRRIEDALLAELPVIPIAWGDDNQPVEVFVVRPSVHGFHDPRTGFARLDELEHAWLDR